VEERINLGVRRQLNAIIAYVKYILNTNQKKSDFKPEENNYEMSTICSNVSQIYSIILILEIIFK
jgi:hypothetical protein